MTSILKASILGAVALIVFGGISVQQAYEAINWTVIFLLVGILPMGIAMERPAWRRCSARRSRKQAPATGNWR